MHQEQREQTRDLLRERGIHQALFGKPHTITWLTGFFAPVQTGPNLFAAGNNPLLWYDDGRYTLIVLDTQASLAERFAEQDDGRVVTYQGYSVDEPIASAQHLFD